MDFLPHDGSYFDDQRADDVRDQAMRLKRVAPSDVDPEMLPFYLDIKNRPHARVMVKSPTVAHGVEHLLQAWYQSGTITHKPGIFLNPMLGTTQIAVEG